MQLLIDNGVRECEEARFRCESVPQKLFDRCELSEHEKDEFLQLSVLMIGTFRLMEVNLESLRNSSAESTMDGLESEQSPWSEEKNDRRRELIDKKIQQTITDEERTELQRLQHEAEVYLDREAPLPIDAARRMHKELLEKKRQHEQQQGNE